MPTRIDFVASASTTFTASPAGVVAAMPSVDGSNVDLSVTNTGGSPITFQLGNSTSILSGPANPSCIAIIPGQVLLFTSPTTAASAAQPANVLASGAFAGAATYIGATSIAPAGSLVVTRGTASPKITF